MKILIMLTRRHNAILRVEDTLLHMGYEVEKIYVDHFQSSHSYLLKKLDEIGVSKFKEEYERSIYDKACHIIQNMDVKRVLCINFILPEKYREKFKKLLKNKCPNILWLVDPVNRNDGIHNRMFSLYFDKVCSYEQADVDYLNNKNGSNVFYVPVGYNMAYVKDKSEIKTTDIVFVGSPYKDRMELLDKLAEEAEKRNWTLAVYGPFYGEGRYFWKKHKSRIKYPYLFKYVQDGVFSSEQIADIYAKAKICLNIHLANAKGMNPRSYEIMATGSFQLMDKRDYYGDCVPNRDFAIYNDYDDMVRQIEKYLTNEKIREQIANSGKQSIKNLSMEVCMKKILDL